MISAWEMLQTLVELLQVLELLQDEDLEEGVKT